MGKTNRYSNTRCKIVNNGYFSESFELSRGAKQGCPLSPYLFVMDIEMQINYWTASGFLFLIPSLTVEVYLL
jgi:hypothetical protein